MPEEFLMIPIDDQIAVETRLSWVGPAKLAVICHPHPLYGGDMDNNLVLAVVAVFQEQGWSTVRFNFRGVGQSSGQYAEGIGEGEDLKAVCRHVRNLPRKPEKLCVVGYSFGAWVALSAIGTGLACDCLVLVSPPIDFMSFEDLHLPPIPCLITLGECDDFCRVPSLHAWLQKQRLTGMGPQVKTLPGVDHFYWGREKLLQEHIRRFLESDAGGR